MFQYLAAAFPQYRNRFADPLHGKAGRSERPGKLDIPYRPRFVDVQEYDPGHEAELVELTGGYGIMLLTLLAELVYFLFVKPARATFRYFWRFYNGDLPFWQATVIWFVGLAVVALLAIVVFPPR